MRFKRFPLESLRKLLVFQSINCFYKIIQFFIQFRKPDEVSKASQELLAVKGR